MRACVLAFAVVLGACLVLDYARAQQEACHPAQCIEANRCTVKTKSNPCPIAGDVCCPKIKKKAMHRCDHFLGHCTPSCNQPTLRRNADDCPAGEQCCVLV